MQTERARLRRLQRLETVRALARREAAREAAEAEGTLAQLEALAARTRSIADDYRGHRTSPDGHALRQMQQFVSGLGGIASATDRDALHARALADRRQAELALAERRRAAVAQRAEAERRALSRRLEERPLEPRRQLGTGLE